VNARLRKILETRGHFPSNDAASKLIRLALGTIAAHLGARSARLEDSHEPIRDPLPGPFQADAA
jgi:hypothetical protein